MIAQLHLGDQSIQDLAKPFSSMTFQGVSKHVKVLEASGLISKKRQGKYQICSLRQDAFADSLKWISYYSNFWNESLDQLAALIQEQSSDPS